MVDFLRRQQLYSGEANMNYWGLSILGGGLFSIVSAALNWDYFMNNSKAWWAVKLFRRNGARIFYILFGGGLGVVGVLITVGIIQDSAG